MSESEIARLRQQIECECEASWMALHGLNSGMAQHEIISSRLRRIDICHGQLSLLMGDEGATSLICEVFNQQGERFAPSPKVYASTNAAESRNSSAGTLTDTLSGQETL